jgi:hypothetical protein
MRQSSIHLRQRPRLGRQRAQNMRQQAINEIVVDLPKTVGDPASIIGVLKTTALLECVDFSRKETCQADMPRVGEYVETDVQLMRRINM